MNAAIALFLRRFGKVLLLLLGIGAVGFLGYQIGVRTLLQADSAGHGNEIWTCAMHPQIKLPAPGKCPICFMDLTLAKDTPKGPPRELTLSVEAAALADVRTAKVVAQHVTHTVRMVGKIDFSESRLAYITARTPGRLERLFVDYTGVAVREGDHLVELFSPTLTVAQHELLQAIRAGESRPDAISTAAIRRAEEKLRLLGIMPKQIDEIKKTGQPTDRITIHAPIGGVVIRKEATEGMYVETGTKIYTIANLSEVWALLDAYESDLPWIRYGQEVDFTTESDPGRVFTGRVSFIDPVLNEATRTVRVRVNVPNREGKLKPGMFVRARVRSQLTQEGRVVDPAMAGKWISPMHPEIVKDEPGKCDVCGMDLVPAEQMGFVAATSDNPPLLVPATAPLITGKRAIVYVKLPYKRGAMELPTSDRKYEGREVLLGPRAGDWYVVRHGLEPGEEVVVAGGFKLDADLQIQGRLSMMNTTLAGEAPGEKATTALPVPSAFRAALSPIYEHYLAAGDALARGELNKVRLELKELSDSVKKVDSSELESDVHRTWRDAANQIAFAAYETLDAGDLTEARREYQALSSATRRVADSFGHALARPLQVVEGPAVTPSLSAMWLQSDAEIRDPYTGALGKTQARVVASLPPARQVAATPAFFRQLSTVYDGYFALHSALAKDKAAEAVAGAVALRKTIDAVDAKSLDAASREAWSTRRKALLDSLAKIEPDVPATALRQKFEPLSLAMLDVVDTFGHVRGAPLYKAYCPMAFELDDGKQRGAPWLQASERIENPYRIDMPRCGEIQRPFKPASPAVEP